MEKFVVCWMKPRNKAAEIIQGNRETHKLIAEALLKYETLIVFKLNHYMKQENAWKIVKHELEEEVPYDEIKSKIGEENN